MEPTVVPRAVKPAVVVFGAVEPTVVPMVVEPAVVDFGAVDVQAKPNLEAVLTNSAGQVCKQKQARHKIQTQKYLLFFCAK